MVFNLKRTAYFDSVRVGSDSIGSVREFCPILLNTYKNIDNCIREFAYRIRYKIYATLKGKIDAHKKEEDNCSKFDANKICKK